MLIEHEGRRPVVELMPDVARRYAELFGRHRGDRMLGR
jgi:hypothetical protein